MSFNQEEFNRFVLDNCEIFFLEKEKELVSGRKTHFYFNWRLNDTFLVDELSKYIILFVKDKGLNPDCFYGVPDGATGLANITQLNLARQSLGYSQGSHPFPIGRKNPKIRGGIASYFVNEPKDKTIILEDTITLGTNLFPEIEKVKNHSDAEILAIISLTDRMQKNDEGLSVKERLDKLGYSYFALSNALELLPEAYRRLNPGKQVAKLIEEEFEKYGVEKLKLL